MAKHSKPPNLTVIAPDANPHGAPANLGKAGRDLWQSIMDEYCIGDSGGLALLQQCAEAADEIAACAEIIARDGRMIRGKFGMREHPLLRHQTALRGFLTRTLQRLGLNLEPVRPVGRPPGPGW